jgi:hypothetical protein
MTVIHTLRGKSFVEVEDEFRIYMLEGKRVKDELPMGYILKRGELVLDASTDEQIGIGFRLPNAPEIVSMMEGIEATVINEEWFGDADSDLGEHVSAFCQIVDSVVSKFPGFQSFLSGLIGEMIFLKQVLENSSTDSAKQDWLTSWSGHTNTSRDFIGEKIAIEIKTTTETSSRHKMSNINQTSLKDTEGGKIEKLFLASISIDFETGDLTLPGVITEILELLPSSVDQDSFLSKIASYGGVSGPSYYHKTHSEFDAYLSNTFCINFVRIFDLGDSRLKIPRKDTFADMDHLEVSSLSFTVNLPDSVGSPPENPISVSDLTAGFSNLLK